MQSKLLERLPTLQKLHGVRGSAKSEFFMGLGTIGLNLTDLVYGGYWCTPRNSVTFAHTGGDGTHFSYVILDNELDDDSPIVMSCPANSEDSCTIVGENLRDFLCLGFHCGYSVLEQLSYSPSSFDILKDPFDDEADEDADSEFTDEFNGCLQHVISEFSLQPWDNWRSKLKALKQQYFDSLLMPFSDEVDRMIEDGR